MSNQLAVLIPVSDVERMAVAVAKSGLFGVNTPDQALALMLVAQSEGRHPASAAKEYHIIKGRPSLKADAMLARFQQAGGSITWDERTDVKVSATFSHPQGGKVPITWTIEDAKRAGLANGDNWKKYPRQMLSARVISEGVRAVYPSVVSGLYTPEEVQDFTPAESSAKPAIAKPVFSKPVPVEDPEVIEAQILKDEVKSQVNPHDDLFRLMDENKVSEEDVRSFCLSKGMKDVPEFVADFSDKLKERLVNVFSEIIAFSLKN
jgi:hypothetical protein